jgi:hypothetical protein
MCLSNFLKPGRDTYPLSVYWTADDIAVRRGSAVGIATGYELDGWGLEFESQLCEEISLLSIVQTGSGAHTASYPMRTGRFITRG